MYEHIYIYIYIYVYIYTYIYIYRHDFRLAYRHEAVSKDSPTYAVLQLSTLSQSRIMDLELSFLQVPSKSQGVHVQACFAI